MILGFSKTRIVGGCKIPTDFKEKIKSGKKLHTVRFDFHDRWKPGRKIHFVYGARSSNYECFKEGECKSVQDVFIKQYNNDPHHPHNYVMIDGRKLDYPRLEWFIGNDGFDTIYEFWEWFSSYGTFSGKLIHWSNLKY